MTTTTMTSMDEAQKESHSSDGEESVAETLAERRALHNSVERTRREALNGKFTHLAQQLPSLSHIHRPSKSVIISHCLDMVVDLQATKAENEMLRQELNYFRMSMGGNRQQSPMALSQQYAAPQQELLLHGRNSFDAVGDTAKSPLKRPSNGSGSLGSASPRDFRAVAATYSAAIPSTQHYLQGPLRQRHSISGPAMYPSKLSPNAYWQQKPGYAQPMLSPGQVQQQGQGQGQGQQHQHQQQQDHAHQEAQFYGNTGFPLELNMQNPIARLQSESSHSTGIGDGLDALDMDKPQFYPIDYAHSLNGLEQQQYLKQEDYGVA